MEEVQHPPAAVEVKRKRERPPAPIKGDGITVRQELFVCNFTGEMCKNAIFLPGVVGACFANLPVARAWLYTKDGIDDDRRAKIFEAACAQFEQAVEGVPVLTSVRDLAQFGGTMGVNQWLPNYGMWHAHAQKYGQNVEQYTAAQKKPRKKPAKKPTTPKLELAKGTHLLSHTNKLKAKTVAADAGGKERFTAVAAMQKLHKFCADHPDTYSELLVHGPNDSCAVVLTRSDCSVSEEARNEAATRLFQVHCHGPAVVFAQKKLTVVFSTE